MKRLHVEIIFGRFGGIDTDKIGDAAKLAQTFVFPLRYKYLLVYLKREIARECCRVANCYIVLDCAAIGEYRGSIDTAVSCPRFPVFIDVECLVQSPRHP